MAWDHLSAGDGTTSRGPPASASLRVRWPQVPIDGFEKAAMAFGEVRVFEVREVLRLWLAGEGIRSVGRLALIDRKTVRRHVDAAVQLGVVRGGGDDDRSQTGR